MRITDRHVQLFEAANDDDLRWVAFRIAPGAGFPPESVTPATVASLSPRDLGELESRITEAYRLRLDDEEAA